MAETEQGAAPNTRVNVNGKSLAECLSPCQVVVVQGHCKDRTQQRLGFGGHGRSISGLARNRLNRIVPHNCLLRRRTGELPSGRSV